jgi:DNA-binding MarR family transcriptional regulator
LATTDDKEEGEMQKVVYVDEQNPNPLDEALLAIIKLRDGTISLSEVSSMLGVTKTSLMQSIDRLQQSHLIEKSQR